MDYYLFLRSHYGVNYSYVPDSDPVGVLCSMHLLDVIDSCWYGFCLKYL